MIDLTRIKALIDGHDLIKGVDVLPKGHVRLETAFLYPDGGSIDVFVVLDSPLLPPTKLSDLGQTMSWLLDVQVKPWLSKKRQGFLEDALRLYSVEQNQGALEVHILTLDQLMSGVVRLGQACVRAADLLYTRRSSLQSVFNEEIEEILIDAEVRYEQNAELKGRYGKLVRVDFVAHGSRTASAVLALSSGNASQAHTQANEIFRRWYDLKIPERTEQRITVFDDRYDVYREDDMSRLRDLSDVVALSDRQSIADLLVA